MLFCFYLWVPSFLSCSSSFFSYLPPYTCFFSGLPQRCVPILSGSESKWVAYHRPVAIHFSDHHVWDYELTRPCCTTPWTRCSAWGWRQDFGLRFSLVSSASVLPLRGQQEKKENGGWQDMQIVAPPKEKEQSFPASECEWVLPLSHSPRTFEWKSFFRSTLATRNTQSHTNEFMHLFCL